MIPAGQSSELGKERAETLVGKAIGDVYRRLGEEWVRTRKSADLGSNMASAFAEFANGFLDRSSDDGKRLSPTTQI